MKRHKTPLRDRELVEMLSSEPGLLAIADALVATDALRRHQQPRLGMPRLNIARPVLVAMMAALVALALVPIGGASLGSRAISGISGLWTPGAPPPAPAPYKPGDKVWTTTPPANNNSQQFSPPAGYTAPQPPAAPPAYKPGDKVWTTTPPPTTPQTTTTIACSTPSDAAKALAELEQEGSPITSVQCR
jgi:hypothetical protein